MPEVKIECWTKQDCCAGAYCKTGITITLTDLAEQLEKQGYEVRGKPKEITSASLCDTCLLEKDCQDSTYHTGKHSGDCSAYKPVCTCGKEKEIEPLNLSQIYPNDCLVVADRLNALITAHNERVMREGR